LPTEIVGAFMAVGVAFCFGTGVVLARVGLVSVPSSTGNLLSVFSGWVPLAVVAAVLYNDALFTMPAAAYLWMAAAGSVNFPLGRFCSMASIKLLGVARANPVTSMSPLVTAFVGIVFLNERMTWPIALGIVVTMGGVIMVVTAGLRDSRPRAVAVPAGGAPEAMTARSRLRTPLYMGYAAAFGSAIIYGIMPALSKQAVSYSTNPIMTASFTLLTGSLILSLVFAPRIPRDLRVSPWRALAFVAAGGVAMSGGVVLGYGAVLRAPIIVVSPIISAQPVVSLALAHIFLQRLERITWPLVAGTLLVVGGVVAITFGIET
jgi:drug/metabolite transporter (DMT)-like permease